MTSKPEVMGQPGCRRRGPEVGLGEITIDLLEARSGAFHDPDREGFLHVCAFDVADSRNSLDVSAKMHSESYWVFFEARATHSSNLESKSFRMGDWFDFL